MAKNGIIGNYLYVSSKTGLGMTELKKAMLDADIKNHGDKIRPPQKKKKPKKETVLRDLVDDSYEALDDDEMPEVIPGLMGSKSKSYAVGGGKKGKGDDGDELAVAKVRSQPPGHMKNNRGRK